MRVACQICGIQRLGVLRRVLVEVYLDFSSGWFGTWFQFSLYEGAFVFALLHDTDNRSHADALVIQIPDMKHESDVPHKQEPYYKPYHLRFAFLSVLLTAFNWVNPLP